jgi:hypothetical protein
VVAFRSDEACIGLKVMPRARSDSTLTLTQEKRKRANKLGHDELEYADGNGGRAWHACAFRHGQGGRG